MNFFDDLKYLCSRLKSTTWLFWEYLKPLWFHYIWFDFSEDAKIRVRGEMVKGLDGIERRYYTNHEKFVIMGLALFLWAQILGSIDRARAKESKSTYGASEEDVLKYGNLSEGTKTWLKSN